MSFPGRRARIVVGFAVLLAGIVIATVLVEIAGRYRWAQESLDDIEPLYARLEGLMEVGPLIEANFMQGHAALSTVAYTAQFEVGQVGTDFQQKIRRLAESSDMRVAGTQILPPRTLEGFMLVTVAATLNGNGEAVMEFLDALEGEHPTVIVDRLSLQAPRIRRRGESERQLTMQANLSVIYLLP